MIANTDDQPHAEQVPHTNALRAAHQGNDPAEPGIGPASQAQPLAVQGEAGKYKEQAKQRVEQPHCRLRQCVVRHRWRRFTPDKQVIENLTPQIPPPGCAPYRQIQELARILVADDAPVNANREADCKYIARNKVNQAQVTHQEMLAGLTADTR